MLNINNFIFKLNKTTSTTKYYRCEDSCCTVTVRTDLEDTFLNINSDHFHPPEPEEIQIRVFKQVAKARAISSTLNKARRLQTPSIPNSQLFDIPESYTKTFGCAFALLPDRKKHTYKYLFHELHNKAAQLNMTFNPCTIMSDFERTLAEILKIEAFIRCIQGEANTFNHLLIQMKGGLTARPKTKKTLAIQHRIDTLYIRYDNGDINVNELLDGLSFVVAKNIKSKRK
ncbi:unnamed protein product [Rotaria sp. Silwood2]|nr:unnamed protein product [Rotaria sp. Silwood2]CAF4142067.1 unnamed protein product [Rotaria sp. Silwood2]